MQIRLGRLACTCGLLVAIYPAAAQEPGSQGRPGAAQTAAGGEVRTGPVARIGQDAPDFTLLDCDGKKHTLATHKDKIVVLEWLNQQCPFSVGAVPVMKELRKKYAGKNLVWLGIESTFWRKPEENIQYIKDKGLDFSILMDNDGTVGRLYGAKATPHIFVINKGKLVYAGALRSKPEGEKPEAESRNYLDEVLKAVLDGKEIPVAETVPWGCSVKYRSSGGDKKDSKPASAGDDKK
jgi:peroxiredoxin